MIEEEEEIENEEIDENLIYEDEYESVNEKILTAMSQLESKNKEKISNLQTKNNNKLNKLKLLLYQKFFNILFSIISQHIKKHLRYINDLTMVQVIGNKKYVVNNKKYKMPTFYLKSMVRQKERQDKMKQIKEHHNQIKKQQEIEKSKKVKTETEIEYEKFQEKTKLEKLNKEMREKYKLDLIRKEAYADKLFSFFSKRRFLRCLKFNIEVRNVSIIFLNNINNKIIKINGIKILQDCLVKKKEYDIKKEQLDLINAYNVYLHNLKFKLMAILNKNFVICYERYRNIIRQIKKKRKKKILYHFKIVLNREKISYNNMLKEYNLKRKFQNKKNFFYMLSALINDKKEQKMKDDLMNKLKSKAQLLLGNYNS